MATTAPIASSVRTLHERLFRNSTQPVCCAGVITIVCLWITVSVGATHFTFAILGAVTYALFFQHLPVHMTPSEGKSTAGPLASTSTQGSGASVAEVRSDHKPHAVNFWYPAPSGDHNSRSADPLYPSRVIMPPPGLELPQPPTTHIESLFNPLILGPTNLSGCASVATETGGLQCARECAPKVELEWGLHLRDTMLALSCAPPKQSENANMNYQIQRPYEKLEYVPTDDNSLRAIMRKLDAVAPERVFMARKITKLGFKSDQILQAHFQQFGRVEQVLVCHAMVKSPNREKRPRVRPGNTGFVIMSTVEEVAAALEGGSEQTVQGAVVTVSNYQSRRTQQGLDIQ